MNILKTTFAGIILALSCGAFAETENFNMALTGEFDKTFCVISVTRDNRLGNVIEDIRSKRTNHNGLIYWQAGRYTRAIECSEQVRVTVSANVPKDYFYTSDGLTAKVVYRNTYHLLGEHPIRAIYSGISHEIVVPEGAKLIQDIRVWLRGMESAFEGIPNNYFISNDVVTTIE